MKTQTSPNHSSQGTQISRIHTNVSITGLRLMPLVTIRAIRVFVAFACCVACLSSSVAEDEIKFPSPDGAFALRIADAGDSGERKVELIEKASGKVMVDLGVPWRSQVLVWSPDSKWVAYGNRGDKAGEVSVYFWNGSTFEEVPLPDELPSPDIKFRKEHKSGHVKNYGGAVTPLRWLKSGELELRSEERRVGKEGRVGAWVEDRTIE